VKIWRVLKGVAKKKLGCVAEEEVRGCGHEKVVRGWGYMQRVAARRVLCVIEEVGLISMLVLHSAQVRRWG